MPATSAPSVARQLRSNWIALAVLAGSLLWAYWPSLARLIHRWQGDPQISHGFLVPAFAVALLWIRRNELQKTTWQTNWWGLALLAGGLAIRICGGYVDIAWLEDIALLPVLSGLFLLLGGWQALRWGWPAIAFLFFMMPLPYRLETMLAYPLRRLATITSTYALQTVGFAALADGTDIYLKDLEQPLRVAPACSGLGMLMVFFAISSATALLSERPWVDRLVILLSAIPIAIVANIFRITLTGVLFQFTASKRAHEIFHDWAGYLMMVVALVILWLELKIFDRLFVPVEATRPPVFALPHAKKSDVEPAHT
jgi:exosortase